MPKIEKSKRRDAKRLKQTQMVVDGRGLVTDKPNWQERYKRAKRKRTSTEA